ARGAAVETLMVSLPVPEGITTPIEVADVLCNGMEIEPPERPGILTWGAEPKLLPLIVTIVPTVRVWGASRGMVGAPAAATESASVPELAPVEVFCTATVNVPALRVRGPVM